MFSRLFHRPPSLALSITCAGLLGCGLLGCGLVGCDKDRESSASAAPPSAPPEYDVIAVEPRSATLHIDVPASVMGQQNVEIRPMIDGYIEEILVDEGAWVKESQKLFKIKAPQYEQAVRTAEAGIKTAEAAVSSARMSVDKVRPLVERKIISEYELSEAQFTLEARAAELAQARAALANARVNLGYTTVSSPAGGVIGQLPFKVGSLVSGSMEQPLTTVSNIEQVHAYFSVNEKVMLSMTRGLDGSTFQERIQQIPEVLFILADGRTYEHKGQVQSASGLINRETGSTKFRATFPNPKGVLRSGASGLVRIPRTVREALLVPQSATYELQGKRFTYVVQPDNTIRPQEISVRPTPDGRFFVVDNGLARGDRVVLEGVASLKAGGRIAPVATELAWDVSSPEAGL